MGTVHYLARADNHTLFTLGKWANLGGLFLDIDSPVRATPHWRPFELPSETALVAGIAHYHRDWPRATAQIDVDAYIAEVARRLIAFADGHAVELLDDCESDFDDYCTNDELNVIDGVYTSNWGDWAAKHPGPGAGADRS